MTDREAFAQVERLIADFENRIARQREVVASAFQKGHETDIAISMLRALEASLSAFSRGNETSPQTPTQPPRATAADCGIEACTEAPHDWPNLWNGSSQAAFVIQRTNGPEGRNNARQ